MSNGRPTHLISQIAGWLIELIAGLGLAAALPACQSDAVEALVPPAPPATLAATPVQQLAERAKPVAVAAAPAPANDGPKELGAFEITFYYVIGEDEIAAKIAAKKKPVNDNHSEELASIDDTREVTTIYNPRCEAIAQVQPEFASALALQGTGKLNDGRVVNISGGCRCEHTPCFEVTENQWGNAGSGRPLQPFRTVAVDPKVIAIGSLLYVPLLEGRTMPGRAPWGGFVHDGCVVADDTGGGIDGKQLDLFVGRHAYFLGLSGQEGSHSWARHAQVFDGSKICQRKGREVGRRVGGV